MHGPDDKTSLELPMDQNYHQKVLYSEWIGVILDRITGYKKQGWRFWSAPSWFAQGYEEYLSITNTGPEIRRAYYPQYLRRLSQPNVVDITFGVNVSSPYMGGVLLLMFMNEEFGEDSLLKVLESPKPNFRQAVKATLGLLVDEFGQRFTAWSLRKRKANVNYGKITLEEL